MLHRECGTARLSDDVSPSNLPFEVPELEQVLYCLHAKSGTVTQHEVEDARTRANDQHGQPPRGAAIHGPVNHCES